MMKRYDSNAHDGSMTEDNGGEFVKVEDVLEALGEKKPNPLDIAPPKLIARLVLIGPDGRTIYSAPLQHGQMVEFDAPAFGVKQICLELLEAPK